MKGINLFKISGKTVKYLIIGLLSFVLISISAIHYSSSPDYTIPGVTQPSGFQFPQLNFNLCPIFPFLPFCGSTEREQNTPPTTSPTLSSSSISLVSFAIVLLFAILTIVMIFFVVRILRRKLRSSTLIKGGTKNVEEKVQSLKFSRSRAESLLKLALETGEYTTGIINAYIALDEALDNFREIARPKHWTPKEYAMSVKQPVFRPTVYKIVEKFYEIRYGLRLAEEHEVKLFLELLNKLFDSEILGKEKDEMLQEFEKIKVQFLDYQIPTKGSLFKPQKGR